MIPRAPETETGLRTAVLRAVINALLLETAAAIVLAACIWWF
jgi:hypothetical protein